CFAILISFAIPLGAIALVTNGAAYDSDNHPYLWLIPVGFVYYFINAFIVVFCNSALVSCALMRFNGETPTVKDGFRAAWARLPQIAAWSAVSATVTVLLRLIENAHEKAGQFIAMILGTAWSIMTYFVVPVLVVEKVGPIDAVKRSVQILRKTWGEALVGNFGLGFFQLLLFLPALLFIVPAVLCFMAGGVFIWLGVVFVVLAVVYLVIYAAVVSALDTIFLTALYQYAAFNQVPGGFEADTIA